LIQTLTFGYILREFLDNDPTKAIAFAGVLLLIAAGATMLIKSGKISDNQEVVMGGGGH
jgi:maltose/moltooligosaccharide transporter